MSQIAYVNGTFLPEEEAKISIFDRGFLFADAVYEVITVVNSALINRQAHRERLQRSLREMRLESPITIDDIEHIQEQIVQRNNITEGRVYMQISRGPAERDFAFPENPQPTLIMFGRQAEDIALLLRGIEPQQEVGRRQVEKAQGMRLNELRQVQDSPKRLAGSGNLHGQQLVAGFARGHQVADRANTAGAGRECGHLIEGAAFTELFKSPVLGHMKTGITYHTVVIQVDGDFGVPLNTGHRVDDDFFSHLFSFIQTLHYRPVQGGDPPAIR